jgi:DNA repair exonuclease SbcCD ATPase subunit
MKNKSSMWEDRKSKDIVELKQAIEELKAFDTSKDIENHRHNEKVKENNFAYRELKSKSASLEKSLNDVESSISTLSTSLQQYNSSSNCPTCGNIMGEDKRIAKIEEIANRIVDKEQELESIAVQLAEVMAELEGMHLMDHLPTFYRTMEESMNANNKITKLESDLERIENDVNPYIEQISDMESTGYQELDYKYINDLTKMQEHQEFLLKLLTNKDSFIRKSIIDQNLILLNNRLEEYADKLGLPHSVKFKPDLDVEIVKYGKDFDFDNLSRGEKTRLILSLSWAFRDVYESLNDRINLLFIDELMDNGLDTNGVECGLKSLKKMTKENGRNVFLVSHREELIGRVSGILKVIKENDFTSFECNYNGNV